MVSPLIACGNVDAIPRFEKGADDAVFGQHGELIGPLIVEGPVAVGTPFTRMSPPVRGDQFLGRRKYSSLDIFPNSF